ncbi:MAG: AMP-dependent synthetase/ligase [Myxococcales bacterium]
MVDEVHKGPALTEAAFRSIPEMVAARAAIEPGRAAVRWRSAAGKWQDLTWAALDERRRRIAAGLSALGVKGGDVVAMLSPNSAEMLLAELAAMTVGAATSPIFPGYAAPVLQHCLGDSGARVAFAGSAVQQHQLAASRQLERIVVLDDQPLPDEARALPLKSLETAGSIDQPQAAREDVAFLLYTSGTTGNPKGVELTHWNALSQQAAIAAMWDVSDQDVFLSYLPWHHCFGALFERLMALWHRALLVLDDSRGRDLDRLYANLFEVKPTVYFGVPRVYNGMIARAQRDAKARDALQALRFAFSAAAPISEPAFRFFEDLGVPVLEGWGLTETSPCVTITRITDKKRAPGVVGHPLPGTSVRLDPVEQFPGRGEILVSGPQVMKGYHRRPDDSARVLRDGWLRSGDLGEWTAHGLQLRGRLDGVFKLANGEKVSAGEVEARVLAATPLLEQAVVLGSAQPFVTALCWIAAPAAQKYLEGLGVDPPATVAELVQIPELRRAIVEALQAGNLLSPAYYERVRRVALVAEVPSMETGELTPTQKMVRAVSSRRHEALIAALREDLPHPQVLDIIRRGDAFQNA